MQHRSASIRKACDQQNVLTDALCHRTAQTRTDTRSEAPCNTGRRETLKQRTKDQYTLDRRAARENALTTVPCNTGQRKHRPSIRTRNHAAPACACMACEHRLRERMCRLPYPSTPGDGSPFHQSGQRSIRPRSACEMHVIQNTCRPTSCATGPPRTDSDTRREAPCNS